MGSSELRLLKRCAEYCSREEIKIVPQNIRGIYVLFWYRPKLNKYDVVYIGMASNNIARRLRSHARSRIKGEKWTHFSIFEVWENIGEDELRELEGILRHIYRRDTHANALNMQKSFKKIKKIRNNNLEKWQEVKVKAGKNNEKIHKRKYKQSNCQNLNKKRNCKN